MTVRINSKQKREIFRINLSTAVSLHTHHTCLRKIEIFHFYISLTFHFFIWNFFHFNCNHSCWWILAHLSCYMFIYLSLPLNKCLRYPSGAHSCTFFFFRCIRLGDKLWQSRRHLNWDTKRWFNNITSTDSECRRDELGQVQLLAIKRHRGQHTGSRAQWWVDSRDNYHQAEWICSHCVNGHTVCLFNGH